MKNTIIKNKKLKNKKIVEYLFWFCFLLFISIAIILFSKKKNFLENEGIKIPAKVAGFRKHGGLGALNNQIICEYIYEGEVRISYYPKPSFKVEVGDCVEIIRHPTRNNSSLINEKRGAFKCD